MSAPRFVIPGVTYLLSRRCFGRQFLLRPSTKINQIFKFCLAVAADRTGCQVHAFCVLSNHYHAVVTDVHGNLPIFMHWFNEYVAKCANAELGRWESFWAPGSYSSVALTGESDVVDKLVYVYANPVAAGLVRTHEMWPGARSLLDEMGGPTEIMSRPEGFFRENGPVPETAHLTLVPPPGFGADRSRWIQNLRSRVGAREEEIQKEYEQQGLRFFGRRRVLTQSPWARPRSLEPRRGLNPRVAARDKWRRIETLQRLRSFIDAYRASWKRFANGERAVIFPFGTYGMRVWFGVPCSEP